MKLHAMNKPRRTPLFLTDSPAVEPDISSTLNSEVLVLVWWM